MQNLKNYFIQNLKRMNIVKMIIKNYAKTILLN